MPSIVAPEIACKADNETRNIAVDFRGRLDSGEKLISAGLTIVDIASVLTLSDKVISTAILTIKGESVPIGEAVQFKVLGGVAGVTYRIRITVTTDASPAQILKAVIRLEVIADT